MLGADTHHLARISCHCAANVSNVNAATAAEVASYLRKESPDYVFHNGDVVSGEAANGTQVIEAAVKQLFSPLIRAKIPFSTTHGNHDNVSGT